MAPLPENFDHLSWIIVNLLGPVTAGLGLALLLRAVTRGLILVFVLVSICSIILWSAGFDIFTLGTAITNSFGQWHLLLPGKIADNLFSPLAMAAVLIGFALGLILDRLILPRCRT